MMDKNDFRELTQDDLMTEVTYKGKRVGTFNPYSQKTRLIDKLLLTPVTYQEMSEQTGMSVYEIRRYTGSIQ
jgi:hypothetical protein